VGSLESIATGFLAATGLVMSFNVASLLKGGDAWLATLYMLIMVIPISSLLYLKLKVATPETAWQSQEKLRNLLFSLQGVALAFWAFDLTTSFYAINVTGMAVEVNPLGWPLGILGALAYYGPTTVFSYVLLYKIKERVALYAAALMMLVTLGMSAMNLMAGAQNFQVFMNTTALATGVRYVLLALVGAACLAVPFAVKRMVNQPKTFWS
jgi:hypothetical protein